MGRNRADRAGPLPRDPGLLPVLVAAGGARVRPRRRSGDGDAVPGCVRRNVRGARRRLLRLEPVREGPLARPGSGPGTAERRRFASSTRRGPRQNVSEQPRILFVGGLHRSGTTPVTRWIAQRPDVSALTGTGVPEDEGQHLQDVYPPARAHGGPGKFALSPEAHLTDRSPMVTVANAERIWSAWAPHWNLDADLVVEKSPANLVRTRFLQALFPGRSCFLLVVRHPIAVAYATKRWTRRPSWVPPQASRRMELFQAGTGSLVRHWATAHGLFLSDAPFLDHVMIVRYEDLVAEPEAEINGIARFLGLPRRPGDYEVRPGLNERYIERWNRRRVRLARRWSVEREYEDAARRFGYSLRKPGELLRPAPEVARYMSASGPGAAGT
ncbi:MAG: hypothetical protein GEU88_15530 [Solirubrobacterales bacterium]|nr:hypothetical protein [Solirubrobacterales bacterium]